MMAMASEDKEDRQPAVAKVDMRIPQVLEL